MTKHFLSKVISVNETNLFFMHSSTIQQCNFTFMLIIRDSSIDATFKLVSCCVLKNFYCSCVLVGVIFIKLYVMKDTFMNGYFSINIIKVTMQILIKSGSNPKALLFKG